MRFSDNFDINTDDWPAGIERERATDAAAKAVLAKIDAMSDSRRNALIAWLACPWIPNPEGEALQASLEAFGYKLIAKAGFEPGRLGCNFALHLKPEPHT